MTYELTPADRDAISDHQCAFTESGYCIGCGNIDPYGYCKVIREHVHSTTTVLIIESVLYKCGCKHDTRTCPTASTDITDELKMCISMLETEVERLTDIEHQAREDTLKLLIDVIDTDSDAFIDQYQAHSYRLRIKSIINDIRKNNSVIRNPHLKCIYRKKYGKCFHPDKKTTFNCNLNKKENNCPEGYS